MFSAVKKKIATRREEEENYIVVVRTQSVLARANK
jgi:hypothetical protein